MKLARGWEGGGAEGAGSNGCAGQAKQNGSGGVQAGRSSDLGENM